MTGVLEFHADCPACAGDLRFVFSAEVDVDHTTAVLACEACGAGWDIDIYARIRPPERTPGQVHEDRAALAADAAFDSKST